MPSSKNYKRDYDQEYKNYHSKPEQRANRSSRNKAARKKKCKLGEVDHLDGNPKNNSSSNLKCKTKSDNRSYSRKKNSQKYNPHK